MFAIRTTFPLRESALGVDRATFDAALMHWSDFLARQPGFDSFTVLLDDASLFLLSIWADSASFEAAFADAEMPSAIAPFVAYSADPPVPDYPRVLHHRRP